ncbi:hypothetical protein LINPERHAP1_LOCUS28482 [Linum perenne]
MDEQVNNPRCPRIPFSDEEVKAFYKPWSKALVVKVLEKSFSFLAMKRRLEFLWARAGSIQVADMSNNFFLVRFSNENDYNTTAFRGPWKIYDYYIAVSQWSPAFNEEEHIRSILTWVRLPKLPIHYFNSVAVSRIGNFIGKTVRLDLATEEGSRSRYARVCVELDLTKPLLGKYKIEDRVFKIEYESLENVFFDCGGYGHEKENCPELLTEHPSEKIETEPTVTVPEVEELDTGEWMTVQRRNRRKPTKSGHQPQNPKVNVSRFSVLQPEETTPVVNDPLVEVPKHSHSKTPITFPADELAKFKEALDAAMADNSVHKDAEKVKLPKEKSPLDRIILEDVTNKVSSTQNRKTAGKSVMKSSKTDMVSSQDDSLGPVTVVYHNPTFHTPSSLPQSTRTKTTAVRKGSGPKTKDPTSIPSILDQKKCSFKKNPPPQSYQPRLHS